MQQWLHFFRPKLDKSTATLCEIHIQRNKRRQHLGTTHVLTNYDSVHCAHRAALINCSLHLFLYRYVHGVSHAATRACWRAHTSAARTAPIYSNGILRRLGTFSCSLQSHPLRNLFNHFQGTNRRSYRKSHYMNKR